MKYFFSIIFIIVSTVILAQYSIKPFERKVFIENKGQFKNALPKEYQDFEYCIDNGTQILFKNNELIYHFEQDHQAEWMEEEKREHEREEFKTAEEEEREREKFKSTHQYIKMKWVGANPEAKISIETLNPTKYGYGVDWEDTKKGHTVFCKGYKKLTLKNIYEGVDIEYFFTEKTGEIKYNIIATKEADLSQVKFIYEGAKIDLEKESLIIETLNGKLVESAPVSYTTKSKQKIESSFFIDDNNVISFKIEETNQAITIDPVIAVPGLQGGAPVDNGIDQWGNHYVSSANFRLEKIDPAGNILFSVTTASGYYGDMLTSSTGTCYFNAVIGTNSIAYDSNGQFLWSSGGIAECWRFVLNECYGQVYSLTGKRHSVSGFATIDANTGALLNYNGGGSCCYDPHSGVVDDNGDVYTVASNPATIHRWSPANASLATYPSPIPFGYASGYAGFQGYNGMAKLGDFLFLHNGATIAKVNKLTGALVGQKIVPNGSKSGCGGIYVTACGYLVIGSTDGVYLFDNNFNQIDFRPTTGAVYDLVVNDFNQNFAVCGPGHVSEVSFNIPPCIFETNPVIIPSCNGTSTGSIKLNLGGGVPSYTYVWSGNGLTANTDSIGGLAPGTYKCVYSDNNCPVPTIDSVEVTVGIQTVIALFSADPVCFGETSEFENTSTTTVGSITNVSWDFNDGNTSLLSSPSNTYASDGDYEVKLVITATNGCMDSVDTKTVTVSPLPIADFTKTQECNYTPVQFTSSSTVSSGNIAQWSWAFNDNTYENIENPLHLFPEEEFPFLTTYNIHLEVTSSVGCIDDTTISYTPNPTPKSSFTTENACINTTIQFHSQSEVVSPGTLNPAIFNFGDGSALVNSDNPIYSYPTAGDYNITLISTSDNGCIDDTTLTITIHPEPLSNFTSTTICENQPPTLFQNLSTISNGTIVGSDWNFGDETSSLPNPSHDFAEAGIFNVTLTSTSAYNCVNEVSIPVTVLAAPSSKFTVDSPEGCDEHCVAFTNQSVSNSNTIITQIWQYSNGDTLLEESPSVCFRNKSNTEDKKYDVTLITTNDLGCSDTLFLDDYITVFHNPIANFSPSRIEENMYEAEFKMNNFSIGSSFYLWDFGDENTSNDFEPIHVYSDTGTYHITLRAFTINNCIDTIVKPIKVTPVISVYIPNTFTPNNDDVNDIFIFKNYGIVAQGFEFYIFDKWGTNLFYTTDITQGWDGTYKGITAKQDTYVYKLICIDSFGESHEYKGHVTLLK